MDEISEQGMPLWYHMLVCIGEGIVVGEQEHKMLTAWLERDGLIEIRDRGDVMSRTIHRA